MTGVEFTEYINQYHLLPEEISKAAENFKQSDINSLRLSDFLTPKLAQSSSHFLSSNAIYTNTYGVFAKQPPTVDEATWLTKKREERFFFYQILEGAKDKKVTLNSLSFLKLRKLLRSEFFRAYISSITGLNLVSTSAMLVHKMHKGHFLKRHNDKSHDRKIAFILYMSPDWLPEHGGKLNIVDIHGVETSLEPNFNSLTLFDVSKHDYHYISEVLDSYKQTSGVRNGRISINGWFS